jgi:hypothetical protein
VEHGRPGDLTRASRAAPAGAGRCGLGSGVARAAARVKAMREKERVGMGTISAYVHRADTSTDQHKRTGLRVVVTPYICQPPDEHKLHTSVFKPMNIV